MITALKVIPLMTMQQDKGYHLSVEF